MVEQTNHTPEVSPEKPSVNYHSRQFFQSSPKTCSTRGHQLSKGHIFTTINKTCQGFPAIFSGGLLETHGRTSRKVKMKLIVPCWQRGFDQQILAVYFSAEMWVERAEICRTSRTYERHLGRHQMTMCISLCIYIICTPAIAKISYKITILNFHTVDGRKPAPVDMVNISLLTGFYTSQVVQDFIHQPYFILQKVSFTRSFEKIPPQRPLKQCLLGRCPCIFTLGPCISPPLITPTKSDMTMENPPSEDVFPCISY